jgi:Cys-rich four helix bundle protein (predicted Tat secretion target)
MQRRNFLHHSGAAAVAALAAATTSVLAADPPPMDHSMHHHGGAGYATLASAAGSCVVTGQACLAHCLVLLGAGDTSLAECAKSVDQLLVLCTALQALAAQGSKTTPALAKVALDVCTACEKECRKHEGKHAECKACAESCAACAKECKAVAA